MNADLFGLLALQQGSRGCKRCISPSVPPSRVVPGHTLVPNLRLWVGLADRCQGPTRARLKVPLDTAAYASTQLGAPACTWTRSARLCHVQTCQGALSR